MGYNKIATVFLLLCVGSLAAASLTADMRNAISDAMLSSSAGHVRRADSCYVAQCVGLNSNCTALNGNSISLCVDNTWCDLSGTKTCRAIGKYGDTCNPDNRDNDFSCDVANGGNHCTQGLDPGSSCNNDYQCEFQNSSNSGNGGYTAKCTNSKCYGIGQNGACSGNQACLSPYVCGTNGVCTSASGVGADCQSDATCQFGLDCMNGKCANTIADGSPCGNSNSGGGSCSSTSDCAPTNSQGTSYVCTPSYTLAVGAPCDDSEQCGEGLTCFESASRTGTTVGSCIQGVQKSSNKPCNSTTDCVQGEECGCNYQLGNQVCTTMGYNPSGIRQAQIDVISCAQNNKCTYSAGGGVDYSCITSKCQKTYCKSLQLLLSMNSMVTDTLYPQCYLKDIYSRLDALLPGSGSCPNLNPGSSSDGAALIASLSLVLLLALSAL